MSNGETMNPGIRHLVQPSRVILSSDTTAQQDIYQCIIASLRKCLDTQRVYVGLHKLNDSMVKSLGLFHGNQAMVKRTKNYICSVHDVCKTLLNTVKTLMSGDAFLVLQKRINGIWSDVLSPVQRQHYLDNDCRLVYWTLWNKLKQFAKVTNLCTTEYTFETVVCNIIAILYRQCINLDFTVNVDYSDAFIMFKIEFQYIPRNMHTVFALLCFVVVIHWLIFPYPSGLLHWHCGNLTIAPVPAKQPWWIGINNSCEFIMNDCITATKQSTTKPCAYSLGYTVCHLLQGT